MNEDMKSIVELQVLSRIVSSRNWDIVEKGEIDESYFNTVIHGHKTRDVFQFIKNHYNQYHKVPAESTILSSFPDFSFLAEGTESEEYLISTIRKARNNENIVVGINKIIDTFRDKGEDATLAEMKKFLDSYEDGSLKKIGVDLLREGADHRLETLKEAINNPTRVFIPSGLDKLDNILGGGWYRNGELALIQARTGQSKSFFLFKFLTTAVQHGYNAALYEPEMDQDSVGYRVDSMFDSTLSNGNLRKGKNIDVKTYEEYIHKLRTLYSKSFYYLTPEDFKNRCTVSKLKSFCKMNNVGILALDGIEVPRHILDERADRNTPFFTQAGDVATDLLNLSRELKVPIIAVVQANRQEKETELDIDTVSGSYDLSKICTFMLTLKKEGRKVTLKPVKTRAMDEGYSISYITDLDKGIWQEDTSTPVGIIDTSQETRDKSDDLEILDGQNF